MDRFLRTMRLLINSTSIQPLSGQKTLKVKTPSGIVYDLYEPAQAALATYVLVYGLDLAGEKDTRLVRFASACASAGLRAIVPDLAGLKSYSFSLDDLQSIADLADYLHQCFNSDIGVIGFSAGGSYALSVAADKQVDWIDPLLLFSPYYSLDGIPPIRTPKMNTRPVTERDWDHFIWCQLVFTFRCLDRSDFSQVERDELIGFLVEYCNLSPDRKWAKYQKLFHDRPPVEITESVFAGQNLSDFSLREKLGQVRGRVFIFHDPDDYLIPPEHSKYILAELQQRGKPDAQGLLVTNLISHVTPKYSFQLVKSIQAIGMLSNLFPR